MTGRQVFSEIEFPNYVVPDERLFFEDSHEVTISPSQNSIPSTMCQVTTAVVEEEGEVTVPLREEDDSIPTIVESTSSTSSNDINEGETLKPMAIAPVTPSNLSSPIKKNDKYSLVNSFTPMKQGEDDDSDNIMEAPDCWMDQQDDENEEKDETAKSPPPELGRFQRMARKAGIILGGGTLTAVGTFLLFVPAPTPSIYMMIGGMAVLAKEFPAAQRQLDSSRESLLSALDRAKQEDEKIAAAMEAQVQRVGEIHLSVVDNGDDEGGETDELSSEEESVEEEPSLQEDKAAAAPVPIQQKSAVKRHFESVGRNVILPLLNKVCTPLGELGTSTATSNNTSQHEEVTTKSSSPRGVASFDNDEDAKENVAPQMMSPFAKFAQFRANLRAERLKAEEQRERELMLQRINEANLKQCQQEAEEQASESPAIAAMEPIAAA